MAKITLILFDLNGVLYRYDRSARIEALARIANRTPKAVETAIWHTGFEDSADTGKMDADAYLLGFGERLGYQLREAEWLVSLKASLTPIQPALALLSRLREGTTCAVLTNNNLMVKRHFAILYPEIATRIGSQAYVSAEFQALKPDPVVFQRCLARLGAAPESSLFIDDSAANVAGAVAAGLAGHHSISPDDLAAELFARRLL